MTVRGIHRGLFGATLTFVIAGSVVAVPAAKADTVQHLRDGVAGMRATSCEPLRDDPIVAQAAYDINRSNDNWIDQKSRAVPAPDALPVLQDRGYQGSTAATLYGAGKTEADSIKALLLQGYAKIPDCSFSDIGVSVLQGNSAGWILSTVVLAG